jgi:chitodextrinase
VVSYKIYRNGSVAGTTSGTSFSDTGLSAWTTYSYEVSAMNGAGLEGPKSQKVSAKTPDNTPPSAPASLRAEAVSTSQIDLRWRAASDGESGVASYRIYRDGAFIATTADTAFSNTGLERGTTYSYQVAAVNGAGAEGPKSNAATASTPLLVPGVLKPVASEELTFDLAQNYPNPFNPTTAIRFALPQEGRVRLTIYNALGQQVRVLVHAEQGAGVHTVQWDGRDAGGRPASSGIYFYHLEIGTRSAVRRMVLAR